MRSRRTISRRSARRCSSRVTCAATRRCSACPKTRSSARTSAPSSTWPSRRWCRSRGSNAAGARPRRSGRGCSAAPIAFLVAALVAAYMSGERFAVGRWRVDDRRAAAASATAESTAPGDSAGCPTSGAGDADAGDAGGAPTSARRLGAAVTLRTLRRRRQPRRRRRQPARHGAAAAAVLGAGQVRLQLRFKRRFLGRSLRRLGPRRALRPRQGRHRTHAHGDCAAERHARQRRGRERWPSTARPSPRRARQARCMARFSVGADGSVR